MTGLIIPLYSDPNGSWIDILQIHRQFPDVPMIVIINPDNGPGQNFSHDYFNWTQALMNAGIRVIGYVYTEYGSRSAGVIESQTIDYLNWYHVNGLFLDEVSEYSNYSSYYEDLTDICRSLGAEYIVGNPGTSAPLNITQYFNLTVLYENPGIPPLENLSLIVNGTPRSHSSIICYDVEAVNESVLNTILNYFSYVYFTNRGLPNPYASLPEYLYQEMSLVSSLHPANE